MGEGRIVGILALVAVVALVVVQIRLGHHHVEAPAADAATTADALDVEISGCDEITRAPACATSAGSELHLWVAGAGDARLAVSAGGHDLEPKVTTWPDGRSLQVVVPPGATRLDVRADRDAGAAAWSIPLVPAWGDSPRIEEAKDLRSKGHLDEAAAILAEEAASSDGGRSAAVSLLARVEYARGHIDDAVARYRESIALLDAEGRSSAAAVERIALVFLLLERGRFGEVRPLLVEAAERTHDSPEGRTLVAYFEGLLAWDTGDLRSALRLTREAERHAARLGAARLRRMAAQSAARQLLDLGRNGEALEGLRHLLDSDGDAMSACDRADLLDNVGWAALLLAGTERPSDRDFDPREPLERAVAMFRDSCPDPNRVANAMENIAFAELQRGRLVQASAALAEAKRVEHDPSIPDVLFWLHLDGRIALASGDPRRALPSFLREAEVAAALGTNDDQRMAAEDHAEALIALGQKEDALGVLEAADAWVDESGSLIPLGEGKETFFGTRDRAAMLRVKLLVLLHREADAMLAARRARTRLLEGVRAAIALDHLDADAHGRWEALAGRYRSARQAIDADAAHDWELSSDRLAAAIERRKESATTARALLDDALAVLSMPGPREAREQAPRALRPGEIELLYFPTDVGWLGFGRDGEGVRARPLGRIDATASPEDLSRALLSPFDAAIARATRVRLLLYGAVRAIDVHALPWRGRPLLDHAVVEYALGVGDAGDVAPGPRRALLVADPTGNLPAARDEGDAVASAFAAASGWTLQSLRGPDARAEPLRTALGDATLLHYAGHATFGGPDGVDSALPLARGGKLTPGDVLALPRVPPLVSLFGCGTGRESATGALDALGLANAFLAAGAHGVVATSRVVDDRLARDVATIYYARLLGAPDLDPSAALRDALLAVREGTPAADWAAFRALAP